MVAKTANPCTREAEEEGMCLFFKVMLGRLHNNLQASLYNRMKHYLKKKKKKEK